MNRRQLAGGWARRLLPGDGKLVLALIAADTLTGEAEFAGDGVLSDTGFAGLGDAAAELDAGFGDAAESCPVGVAGGDDVAHRVGHLHIMACHSRVAYSMMAHHLLRCNSCFAYA